MTAPYPDPVPVPAGELAAFGLAMAAENERLRSEITDLGSRIGVVIAQAVADERERIRQLADRNGAVCTGDEGTSCFFSALIGEPPETTAGPRITVDLNVRVRRHETYSGFEDVHGADPASLRWGDRVTAVEVETGIYADAIVTGTDPEKQFVYFAPDWHGFQEPPREEQGS